MFVWHCVKRVSKVVWQGLQLQGCMMAMGTDCYPIPHDDSRQYQAWLYDHQQPARDGMVVLTAHPLSPEVPGMAS